MIRNVLQGISLGINLILKMSCVTEKYVFLTTKVELNHILQSSLGCVQSNSVAALAS